MKIVSTSAAPNAYLNSDGMLNFEKVASFYEQLKAKAGDVTPAAFYVTSRKAKPAKYSSVSEKKNDLRYTTRRATKIAARKRLGTDWQIRLKVLFADWSSVEEAGLTAVQKINSRVVVRAIAAHLKKISAVKAKVTKVRAGAKADTAKVFGSSIKLLQGALAESVKPADIVTAKTMFGTSMIVKLGADNYVSVSPSDADKFRAAKKAAVSSETS